MTDRINGVYVTLDKSYRDDDVENILDAIKMIKGVLKVETHIETIEDYYAKTQVLNEIQDELYGFVMNLGNRK